MSKSHQHHLITTNEQPTAKQTKGGAQAQASAPSSAIHTHQVRRRKVASASRWLHIYLSMASFAILFFFAVTGLTLNHAEWFGSGPKTAQQKGKVELKWVKAVEGAADQNAVAKLEVVEYLRRVHGIKGALSDFRVEDAQCDVSFKGPGYTADAFINRETGEYDLTETRMGFVAIINDLHKGRDSGRSWSYIIDISAVLMTLVSLTGMVLIWFVKRRRFSGLILAIVGGLICYLVYVIWVP